MQISFKKYEQYLSIFSPPCLPPDLLRRAHPQRVAARIELAVASSRTRRHTSIDRRRLAYRLHPVRVRQQIFRHNPADFRPLRLGKFTIAIRRIRRNSQPAQRQHQQQSACRQPVYFHDYLLPSGDPLWQAHSPHEMGLPHSVSEPCHSRFAAPRPRSVSAVPSGDTQSGYRSGGKFVVKAGYAGIKILYRVEKLSYLYD
ncbi:hypothetical protein Dda3937_01147 [Dickeya dadantii 3937]|uniref:Uncharacterized protein n=1 Tax=Dickeya dadantii (strain 3937) TaxID=198628 RepID=E0SEM2_DICD3|nr:hypothetical protein Dda3937_01147 [Dickeya dadantii 3937]